MGQEEILIDLVRRNEAVYNTNCDGYRDSKSRNAAWTEIANLYGSTVDDCKEAWSKLRNCYTNAIKRRRKKKNRKFAPWRFEPQMSFLKPHLKARAEDSIKENPLSPDPDTDVTFYEDSWISIPSPQGAQSPDTLRATTPTSILSYKRMPSTENDKNTCLYGMMDTEELSSQIRYGNQDLDDTDHFFLSMSKMTKKLPKIDQLRIKFDLHKAINEVELRQLEQANSKEAADEKAPRRSKIKRKKSEV